MELKGLSRAIIAPLDDKAQFKTIDEFKKYGKYKDTGIFQADLETSKGVTQCNITGLNPTVTEVYGSNQVADNDIGVEKISITFGANDIPFEIDSLMTGLHADTEHGGYKRDDKRIFTGAFIAISDESHGFPVYMAFPFCTFTAGNAKNVATDAQNPSTVHDSFTISVKSRPSDRLMYQYFVGDSTFDPNFKGEEDILKYIIAGYPGSASK